MTTVSRRAALAGAAAALTAGLVRGSVAAEAFPARPVRIIVPFAAGGPTDVIARIVAEALGEIWKQPVVVENRGGAGTILGTNLMAQAPHDGYTIGVATNSFVINPAVRKSLSYDTEKDFAAIGMMVTSPFVLVASPKFEADTLARLTARATAEGEPLAYASPGPGTGGHMAGELLKQRAGLRLEHVPYNGSAPALTDVLAGRVPLMFDLWSSVRPHVEAGRLKVVAVASAAPLPDAPQYPVIAATYPGFVVSAFQAMVAPAGLPPEIARKISADLRAVVASGAFAARVRPLGVEPEPSTAEELQAFLQAEMARWREVAKTADIALD
ncbi:tripartite tricarboxylate transporter substrate binding protein [Roseomonas sp. E05]|uniref:tripartite tricarboxylate transporter substrate binding protein n=1 Tax=Roseomonas sp. E05 TaxID=3046310 RepID=UPI0024BB759C|nr:tripartite tricarboxylate transporter substrate binding protein [Roseomonas sp. E05]MDJ0389177.1 tripartite tricarboxylate transporter substrate binding protein [Roseomonas sp. E05]